MRTRRRGFTMIELMVVIAIMALLAALLWAVLGNTVHTARVKATRATILKIDGVLQDRLETVDRMFSGQGVGAPTVEMVKDRRDYNLDEVRGRIYTRKRLMREAFFPQTFAEAGLTTVPGVNPATESAEVLYWIVTGTNGAGIPGDARPGAQLGIESVDAGLFSTAEYADTDGNGRMEFVDAWGRPLRFYRWPTRLLRPGGLGAPLNRTIASYLFGTLPPPPPAGETDQLDEDPDDPQDRLRSQFYSTASAVAAWEQGAHTPRTYHAFLVVSAGPDGVLGLYDPSDKQNFGHLAQPLSTSPNANPIDDNITNRQN